MTKKHDEELEALREQLATTMGDAAADAQDLMSAIAAIVVRAALLKTGFTPTPELLVGAVLGTAITNDPDADPEKICYIVKRLLPDEYATVMARQAAN